MYPSDLHSLPGFQPSGAGCIHPAQSHDSRAPFVVQGPASEYLFPTAHQLYPSLGHHDLLSQAPQIFGTKSARSIPHSVGSASVKTPVSLSSDPYHQAKLRHRTSAHHQERCQVPYPTAPASLLDTVPSYDATASTFCHGSSQLPLLARGYVSSPISGSTPQSGVVAYDMNQTMSSLMGPVVPGQMSMSPTLSPPSTPADQADIEYAQDRYGGKRCFYQCRFDLSGSPCNKWIVGDRTRVLRHLRNHHHLQTGPATPARCRWEGCTHSRLMKQENLSRHVVMHLGVKWKCPHCSRLFSRDDAVHRHIERMVPGGMAITDAEVVPGREAHALNEL